MENKNNKTITRTSEDVRNELQKAEEQRNLWNARIRSLRREAKILEPQEDSEITEEVVEEAPAEEVTETTEEVVEEAPAEEVTETTEEVVEEAPAEEVTETTEEVVEEAPAEEVTETTEEVVEEAPAEEVTETTEEVVEEAPAEEVTETTEEVVEETPAEEVTETTEEVVEEAPTEEVTETTEEVVEEAPAEEVTETTEEVVEETPAEEVTEATEEVVEEAPAEEVTETTEEVVEEAPVEEVNEEKNKMSAIFAGIIAIFLATIIALLIALLAKSDDQQPADGNATVNPPVSDTTPPAGDTTPDTEVVFDMDAFTQAVANIAGELTDDESLVSIAVDTAKSIGADKLQELVEKYGELPVQTAIAEEVFVAEIKKNQYAANNGLAYNPYATTDYYKQLEELDIVYKEATGKNATGALMSLEGYDDFKGNRDAIRNIISQTGDTALLEWYNAKCIADDVMYQQVQDTKKVNAYEEEVKLQLVTNTNGFLKLLELQLEQGVNGTDPNTLNYTEVYEEFIINNYFYVIAN